mgnify:CR=1 FL=1
MMPYDQRLMPKQRLGQITGRHAEFEVFTTGDPGWLLFCVMTPLGNGHFASTEIQHPVRLSNLKAHWKERLH